MNSPASSRTNTTLLIVLAAVVAAFGFWFGARYANAPAQPKLASALLYPEPRAIPEFQLQQANGKPLTNADWRGRWNFVYFGYASCPDVCPTTLAELKSVWGELAKRGVQDKLRIDFVSVDPERDTPDALAKYVGFFSPDFVAATGTDAELAKLTRALGIVYSRTKKDDGSIEVDHSGSIVIVDPQGRLVGLFRPPFVARSLADDMVTLTGWR
ncbi:MAG: SCO family protein [Rudaea sp.]|uniref:SCO family protein n=1 Tax=Rudaea sp. TaxID=2136325 RepID=UPI0039E65B64